MKVERKKKDVPRYPSTQGLHKSGGRIGNLRKIFSYLGTYDEYHKTTVYLN